MTYPFLTKLLESPRIPAKELPTHMAPVSVQQSGHLRLTRRAEEVVSYINQHCKPFLAQWAGQPLYRGVTLEGDATIKPVRKDRITVDMWPAEQAYVNTLIAKAGLTANRSNALFCSGHLSETQGYGNHTALVFPIGDFKYTWCPAIRDAWSDYGSRKMKIPEDTDFLGDDGSLVRAMRSGHEIMITCEEVVYVRMSFADHFVVPMLRTGKIDPKTSAEYLEKLQRTMK